MAGGDNGEIGQHKTYQNLDLSLKRVLKGKHGALEQERETVRLLGRSLWTH